MGDVECEKVPVTTLSDKELGSFLSKNAISLKLSEARKVAELLGRDPSLTELHIFNTEWSEHCSYKSSRKLLKTLPTEGKTVIQGPAEDAGIILFADVDGERYGICMAHESHNHPSQVVPYEGAATGVGGIVRDVVCMGAKVIATADPLRFGDPNGVSKGQVRYITNAVIDGISGYGNPIGIPNLAGDVYFSESFNDNCLVNVVCLGIIKEKDIIHSAAPENAEGYDIVIVGKGTDISGYGGAAFGSIILDSEEEDFNKGAVQVPDPFLKNVLIRSTEAVLAQAKKQGISIGFKDMGAGGIMCSSSEICDAGGYGADIDLDKAHVTMKDLPPYVIACSETQERFTWACPPEFTQTLLRIYNEDFELPNIAEGARASVIGKVTKEKDYIVRHNGKIVCHAPIEVVTKGILYDRGSFEKECKFSEPNLPEPTDYNSEVLEVLKNPNVASKKNVYKHYDTEVQGLAVIRPGEADAGVQAPLPGFKGGIALSVDSNPYYARISSYHGAVTAVAECMRNVAAVGATPYGMTDCLCYGNPEKPDAFADFKAGVKGISDAARNIYLKGTKDPVPFVSGNVSFYNESVSGKAVDPSVIIACLGVMDDYSKAITMQIKKTGSKLFMIGARKDELGGSAYYQTKKEIGKNVPVIDFELERNMIHGVIDAISSRLLLSCHDISDGGLAACLAEMVLGGEGDGKIGVDVKVDCSKLTPLKVLFSESSGFVFEVEESKIDEVKKIFSGYDVELIALGKTSGDKIIIMDGDTEVINLSIKDCADAWLSGFGEATK